MERALQLAGKSVRIRLGTRLVSGDRDVHTSFLRVVAQAIAVRHDRTEAQGGIDFGRDLLEKREVVCKEAA